MKQKAQLLCPLDENKPFHLLFRLIYEKRKRIKRVGMFHLYFTRNSSFKRAIGKLMDISGDWLAEGYCKRDANISNPIDASIEIKSASVEHFKLQLACLQCWITAQDDLLADMLISQGDGKDED